jgi:tyrosyl-tRNA synthetase
MALFLLLLEPPMTNPHLLDELTQRGLVAQNSDPVALADHLATPRTVYCGFDPTAGSLHIGHLVPLLMLRRFQLAGHTPVALVGGATGLIGDPSFKASERTLNSAETVQGWVASLSAQISALLPASDGLEAPLLVNNADWMGQMSALDFLRDIGKHFSVNARLGRLPCIVYYFFPNSIGIYFFLVPWFFRIDRILLNVGCTRHCSLHKVIVYFHRHIGAG